MSDNWYDNLTPAQKAAFGQHVEVRVRVVGDSYSRAVEYVRANRRDEILAVKS